MLYQIVEADYSFYSLKDILHTSFKFSLNYPIFCNFVVYTLSWVDTSYI